MRPTPVTTPSAGRSPASALASSAFSTNESSSSSSASRSRTNNLFWRGELLALLGEVALERALGVLADPVGVAHDSYRRVRAPACSNALGSSRPTMSCASAAQSSNASRSMPVSISMSSSMCTRSSVTALPDAPGAYGHPPKPADRRVEAGHAAVERGDDVGERGAARVVEVQPDPIARDPGPLERVEQIVDAARRRHAGRVAEREPIRARVDRWPAICATRSGATSPSYGHPNAVETIASTDTPAP